MQTSNVFSPPKKPSFLLLFITLQAPSISSTLQYSTQYILLFLFFYNISMNFTYLNLYVHLNTFVTDAIVGTPTVSSYYVGSFDIIRKTTHNNGNGAMYIRVEFFSPVALFFYFNFISRSFRKILLISKIDFHFH